jgi:hypothetical protein
MACLLQNVGGIVVGAESRNILIKQLVFKNANKSCEIAIQPYRKTVTL